ncbi:hypothetical protein BP6252_03461 [Coleophoma cylindrospora]|uniref:Uncharacterized protein n=1 Tax=Coleophoma cylindrospora TaxID=1849047 RepID=A0A3D8S7R2_9HELO|nr:hypothetical protein BP6252_03461 [Coleophoma cylindrospora]
MSGSAASKTRKDVKVDRILEEPAFRVPSTRQTHESRNTPANSQESTKLIPRKATRKIKAHRKDKEGVREPV